MCINTSLKCPGFIGTPFPKYRFLTNTTTTSLVSLTQKDLIIMQ